MILQTLRLLFGHVQNNISILAVAFEIDELAGKVPFFML